MSKWLPPLVVKSSYNHHSEKGIKGVAMCVLIYDHTWLYFQTGCVYNASRDIVFVQNMKQLMLWTKPIVQRGVIAKVVNSVLVGVSFFQLEWNVSVSECFGVPFRSCTVHTHTHTHTHTHIYIYMQQT